MLRKKRSLFFGKNRYYVREGCRWQDGGVDDGETYSTLYVEPVMAVVVRMMKVILDSQHEDLHHKVRKGVDAGSSTRVPRYSRTWDTVFTSYFSYCKVCCMSSWNTTNTSRHLHFDEGNSCERIVCVP